MIDVSKNFYISAVSKDGKVALASKYPFKRSEFKSTLGVYVGKFRRQEVDLKGFSLLYRFDDIEKDLMYNIDFVNRFCEQDVSIMRKSYGWFAVQSESDLIKLKLTFAGTSHA